MQSCTDGNNAGLSIWPGIVAFGMRWAASFFVFLAATGCALLPPTSAQIMKVLPHYLDVDDRHTKGVTLTDRDLYQKELRDDPKKITGIRFDIKWSGTGLDPAITKLRVEIKSSKAGADTLVINYNAIADNLSATWTPLTVSRADYKKLGKMESWRVSLWEGDSQVAEQKSFLW